MGYIEGPIKIGRYTHEGSNMEKLGVTLDETKVVTRKGVRHCPRCDAQLHRVGPPNCPNCGTAPFETAPVEPPFKPYVPQHGVETENDPWLDLGEGEG